MSVYSPDPFAGFAQGVAATPRAVWGAEHDALRHHMMLERCFDGREARWSEALIARTRRHIGGCVTAVETALQLDLARTEVNGLPIVDALPEGYSWRAIQHRPTIIGTPLLRHFRDRAGLSLMCQEPADAPAMTESSCIYQWFPDPIADQIGALTRAQSYWADGEPDDAPMRTDLPAEIMPQLVWCVAALMVQALSRSDLMPTGELAALLDKAGQSVLARHDEEHSPFAQAALFALQAGESVSEDHILCLARERHILALAALIAQRTSTDIRSVASAIIEKPEQTVFEMCRAADFPREVAVRLVLARRCVSRGVEDSTLIEYADRYESLEPEEARRFMMTMSLDDIFRDRLAVLAGWGPRDAA